eukprot:scaffold11611_cov129-Isochrysis_galbana.AAC.2
MRVCRSSAGRPPWRPAESKSTKYTVTRSHGGPEADIRGPCRLTSATHRASRCARHKVAPTQSCHLGLGQVAQRRNSTALAQNASGAEYSQKPKSSDLARRKFAPHIERARSNTGVSFSVKASSSSAE